MREFVLDAQQEGRRLDRFVSSVALSLPMGLRQKFLRLKKVKVNGRPAQGDVRLHAGDTVSLYIGDEFFERPKAADRFLADFRWHLSILYEDENLLLVDKQPGLICHPDREEKVDTLLHHVQAYLYQKGEWDSQAPGSFAPALCNRIDRFTGGIVLAAKTAGALAVMDQKIRDRELEKYYLAIVHGRMKRPHGTLTHYLLPAGKRVQVLSHPQEGAKKAQTEYRVLAEEGALCLVECRLLTGRTHQIRAQFAACGHPLLGDAQYGDRSLNARYHRTYQALYACRVEFAFTTEAGPLSGLRGRSVSVRHVPFVSEYFHTYREDGSGYEFPKDD